MGKPKKKAGGDVPARREAQLALASKSEAIAPQSSQPKGSARLPADVWEDPLPQRVRESVSRRLETTWVRYIDLLHRFIALNVSVIAGVALAVWFLPKLRPDGVAAVLRWKWLLIFGLVLLLVSLILEVTVRFWVQQFMEYEVLQPRETIDRYFGERPHYTISYRLPQDTYTWQHKTVRTITKVAPAVFFVGLTSEVIFVCVNLP